MKRKGKVRTAAFFMAFFGVVLLFSGAVFAGTDATAAQTGRTVRVGCYDLTGFISKNADGTYTGYGVDYLNMISDYTGWTFDITVTDNDSLKRMLDNGELDFLMPVQYAADRLGDYTYPNNSIGSQYDGIYVLKSRENVYFDDVEALSKMKIGVVADTFPVTSLHKYAQEHGFTYQEMLYPDLQSLNDALSKGEVDAVCRSALGDIPSDYRLVAASDMLPFFIVAGAQPDADLFSQMDNAINSIYSEYPTFTTELYNRYFKNNDFAQEVNFTREETQYIADHPEIRIASFSDRYPVAYTDAQTGELKGIMRDLLDRAAENTGLSFTYTAIPAAAPILKGLDDESVDLVAGAIRTPDYRGNADIRLSLAFQKNTMAIAGSADNTYDAAADYTVAMPEGGVGTITHVRQYHPNYKIDTYPSTEDCLRAVMAGKADAAVQNGDILGSALEHPEFSSLTLWHTFADEGEYNYCLAGRQSDDPRLIAIVNKALNTLDENEVEAVNIKYTSEMNYQATAVDILVKYGPVLLIIGMLALGIIVIVLSNSRRRQQDMTALQAAMDESERANEAKSEFLSRMSHDIRTPLNGIIGMTYLAQEEDNNPKTEDCLDKIDRSSKFLLGLINDILDMTKAESGKIELYPEPYTIDEFNAYLDAVIRPLCEEKNQHFVLDQHSETKLVPLADKLRINQILFNLLSNAVKYTPEGGTITYTSRVSETQEGRLAVTYAISDTGIGMSPDFQERLFQAFTQESRDDNSQSRGSGLGLAIVKKMVDLMGGTIEVQSALGQGSTFIVHLVFDAVTADSPAVSAAPEAEAEGGEDRLAGKHALLCEDHPLNQEIAQALLAKRSVRVDVADNGQIGVEKMMAASPGFYDFILMDLRMPVMDGIEAARRIRALDRPDAGTVPIIAMTADAFEEDVQKCLEAGMNGHIAKPIDPQTLYTTLLSFAEENVG